jgi:paired amphipathic helix protein Sin3a
MMCVADAEILELLRKNPAGTIPVVLKRLRQKDSEWRKARHELNKTWQEVLDKNYEKSFDQKSYYFRQHEKRYYSTKHLMGDIRGMHGPPFHLACV